MNTNYLIHKEIWDTFSLKSDSLNFIESVSFDYKHSEWIINEWIQRFLWTTFNMLVFQLCSHSQGGFLPLGSTMSKVYPAAGVLGKSILQIVWSCTLIFEIHVESYLHLKSLYLWWAAAQLSAICLTEVGGSASVLCVLYDTFKVQECVDLLLTLTLIHLNSFWLIWTLRCSSQSAKSHDLILFV